MIRHPQAQRLQDQSFAITGWWTLLVGFLFVLSLLGSDGLVGRGTGWMLVFLPALPGMMIFFVVKCFPRYRVTRCPFCRFEEVRKLVRRRKRA